MRFCNYSRKLGDKFERDTIGFVIGDRVYPIHQFFNRQHADLVFDFEHDIDRAKVEAEQTEEQRAIRNQIQVDRDKISEMLKQKGHFEHFNFYAGLQLFPFALFTRLKGLLPKQAAVLAADSFALDEIEIDPFAWLYTSFRDFYAFEEHVKTARGNRGLEVPAEWYQFPVFYFSNHRAIIGHEKDLEAPKHGQWLDYELEVAAIIGKQCQDVSAAEAENYIAGYTILNDWSLRDLQREEVKVGLGPAKGKDFATSLGPYLVTPDELEDRRSGKGYNLTMTARVNGVELSRGNWQDIHYSFGEMIARASQGVTLYPGDIIGSGTVGTGCILELTPEHVAKKLGREHGWLQAGDVVELEVERLGVLRNKIT